MVQPEVLVSPQQEVWVGWPWQRRVSGMVGSPGGIQRPPTSSNLHLYICLTDGETPLSTHITEHAKVICLWECHRNSSASLLGHPKENLKKKRITELTRNTEEEWKTLTSFQNNYPNSIHSWEISSNPKCVTIPSWKCCCEFISQPQARGLEVSLLK